MALLNSLPFLLFAFSIISNEIKMQAHFTIIILENIEQRFFEIVPIDILFKLARHQRRPFNYVRLLVCLCYKTWAFALCRELCRARAHALPLAESFLHGGIQSPSYLEQVGHCCPQIHIPLPKTLCYLIEKLYLFYNINYPNQRYFPVCLALFGISPSL